jgi:hypothetical protein
MAVGGKQMIGFAAYLYRIPKAEASDGCTYPSIIHLLQSLVIGFQISRNPSTSI